MCEPISGNFMVLAPNHFAFMLDYIVIQKQKKNNEKGFETLTEFVSIVTCNFLEITWRTTKL